jgi:hypothetical protein
MTRRLDLSRAAPRRRPLPDNLTDQEWWADAEQRYEEYWREFVGSPESFAEGGRWFYGSGEFGAAALMYQKSIDLLHTLYCCGGRGRQPSSADLPMTDGYGNSLGATLSLHPDAPVKSSISEVTHRLTDIFFTCRRAGIRPGLYGTALIDLAPIARRYGISIERSAFAEREGSVINNHGVIATGTHIAVAQGPGAHATVTGPAAVSIDQVFDLLRKFADELSRSESPDVTELAQVVGEMGQELAAPAPRRKRLEILASGLAKAVSGVGALAALAVRIEQAIHGL